MVVKRKHSESELSVSPLSTCSFNNSPLRADSGAFQFDMMKSSLHFSPQKSSSHLHSRTMKRFRDSRPSQREVHERTLNMLYNAQKHQPHDDVHMQTMPMQIQSATAQQPHHHHQQQAQVSLHNFWNLPNTNSASATFNATPASIASPSIDEPTDCEDCGQALHDTMDGDTMDVDDATDWGCGDCGKHVCSHCSITNLGEQRRCLGCAGKKSWVGGIGWTPNAGAGGISQFLS
ncbi:ORF21 [Apiospora marii]|uniref:ORF21 n=1 Tax=Apiospora marii TaxID=335849 RepID=A0ABR1REK7_9PEZI